MRPLPLLGLLSAFLALCVSIDTYAQEPDHRWFAEGAAGVVVPTGEYAKSTSIGPGFAVSIGYTFAPRWIAMGSFTAGFLSEGDIGPASNLYSYFLKAGYDIGDPDKKLSAYIPLGAGVVTFDPDSDVLRSKTHFALSSGLMFQYALDPRFALTLDALVTLAIVNEREFGSDAVWLFPLGVGLLFRL
jgi:hypothetical protein